MNRFAHVLRALLVDPRAIAIALQLDTSMRSQTGGVMVRCPAHDDQTPSCSIQRVADALLWKCHGCGAGGDVFALIAAANDLDCHSDFREILAIANEIATQLAPSRSTDTSAAASRTYPPAQELAEMQLHGEVVEMDEQAAAWCVSRHLDAGRIDDLDLAWVLPRQLPLPNWAAYRGPWNATDHRLIVPTYDASGMMRSVRARAIGPQKLKELSPRGHTTKGLVLANNHAVRMLRGSSTPERVVIVEGTPDFLTRATISPRETVLGIIGGVGLPIDVMQKVPDGADVAVRVDQDKAGREYQAAIVRGLLSKHCRVCVFDEDSAA